MIDEAYELITPYVEKDPTAFCSLEEYEKGVDALRSFCSLRIESIRGQLDGTIPTTDEGQSADGSALVNASAVTISDMGSMNGMGGGFGDRERGERERGDRPDGNSAGGQGGFPDAGNGFPFSGGGNENGFSFPGGGDFSPPDMNADGQGGMSMMQPPENGSFPGMPDSNSSVSRDVWLLLGASAIVLMVGLVIVWRFRRYA